MNNSFNTNRQHQQLLNRQQLARRHEREVANAREATHAAQQERAQGAHEQAQGRFGDTVFRTIPVPPAPPPRQNRAAAHRGEVRQGPADGREEEREELDGPGAAERREGPRQEPVEATDRDGEKRQHHHQEGSQGGTDQGGSFGGSQSGGGQSGGHSEGRQSGGGQSGGGQSGGGQSGGQQGRQSGSGPGARFGSPTAERSAALPVSLAAAQAGEMQAFRNSLASIDRPELRARHLAQAMAALSKPGASRLNNDAMMMSLMAAYIESSVEPGALSTLAKVKQVLVEMGPALAGLLPPGPRERNRLALLPLKLLVCDRRRTEAQRDTAAERLRSAQRWPADTIET